MDTNNDTVASRRAAGDGWAVVLFAPFGVRSESGGTPAVQASGSSVSLPPPTVPPTSVRVTNESIFSTDGWRVLPAFAVPVVLAGVVMLLRRTRIRRPAMVAGMVMLFVFVVLGSLSIGIFYVPAAVLMAIAASRTPGRSQRVDVFA